MPQIRLTNDQKAQLMGWLRREKDHLLSIDAMAERILIPHITGSLDCIKSDLEFATHLRASIRGEDEVVDLTDQDVENLVDIAAKNQFENKVEFWKSIVKSIREGATT